MFLSFSPLFAMFDDSLSTNSEDSYEGGFTAPLPQCFSELPSLRANPMLTQKEQDELNIAESMLVLMRHVCPLCSPPSNHDEH
jgi:hypothetical protein